MKSWSLSCLSRVGRRLCCQASIFDTAWSVDSQALASNLFATSIFPYAGFLYHLHRSKQAPPLTLFGFYFLLVFVFGTIPAGIYAKTHYGTTLANVDWLHGGAESLLTITNLLIVLGLRAGLRKAEQDKEATVKDTNLGATQDVERTSS
ncbi:hypothetical protein WJX72_004276 [[Myrmecia] bisecta]|uniref:DUF3593 domain-containing protein n=1 Tax=[Myrmecia] bisecta TaxID=41462 RepID=A0AAW1R5X2_9CHLO